MVASIAKQSILKQIKSAASYVGEKAAKVKNVTVETGKDGMRYVGKVAGTLNKKTVIAGWEQKR